MAYSSIANVGYVLLGVAAGTERGIQSVVFYLAIYMVMTLGVFAIILLMKRRDVMVENISDLAGPRPQPAAAGLRHADLHVLAGRHPAARGLLGQALRLHGRRRGRLFWPAVLGVLASVVASYYYLRIVKVMYFDEGTEALDRAGLQRQPRRGLRRGHPGRAVLAAAAAAQRHRRRRGQGPVPVTSAPVLPDGWTLVALRKRRQHQ